MPTFQSLCSGARSAGGYRESAAQDEISQLQLDRREYPAALATLNLRLDLLRQSGGVNEAADDLAEDFAAAGATAQAFAVLREFGVPAPAGLQTIAAGQVRGGKLTDARTTLQRLPLLDRGKGYAPYRLASELLLADTDIAATLGELTGADDVQAIAKSAAVELASRGELWRARQILDYAVQRALHDPACRGKQCLEVISSHTPNEPCSHGSHDLDLCNLASVQAQIGLIAQARTTTARILDTDVRLQASSAIVEALVAAGRLDEARAMTARILDTGVRVRASITITEALFAARRPEEARQVFERSLQQALASRSHYSYKIIWAYAGPTHNHPQLRDALPRLQRAARSLRSDSLHPVNDYYADQVLRVLARAHTSAGDFTSAFEVAEHFMYSDRAGAYIEIFDAAQ